MAQVSFLIADLPKRFFAANLLLSQARRSSRAGLAVSQERR